MIEQKNTELVDENATVFTNSFADFLSFFQPLEEWGDWGMRWRFLSDRLLNLIPPVSLIWHQLNGGSFGL